MGAVDLEFGHFHGLGIETGGDEIETAPRVLRLQKESAEKDTHVASLWEDPLVLMRPPSVIY